MGAAILWREHDIEIKIDGSLWLVVISFIIFSSGKHYEWSFMQAQICPKMYSMKCQKYFFYVAQN